MLGIKFADGVPNSDEGEIAPATLVHEAYLVVLGDGRVAFATPQAQIYIGYYVAGQPSGDRLRDVVEEGSGHLQLRTAPHLQLEVRRLISADSLFGVPSSQPSNGYLIRIKDQEALSEPLFSSLTPTEVLVARQLVLGKVAKAIAQDLGISTSTVNVHARNIYAKLGIKSKAQLLALAYRTQRDEKTDWSRAAKRLREHLVRTKISAERAAKAAYDLGMPEDVGMAGLLKELRSGVNMLDRGIRELDVGALSPQSMARIVHMLSAQLEATGKMLTGA